MTDLVNHPPHYQGNVECIEAIEAQLSNEEYRGYLKGNIAKYLWRERTKGGVESLKKAQWYLNRLVDLDEEDSLLNSLADLHEEVANNECKDGFCPLPSNVRTGPAEPLRQLFDPI